MNDEARPASATVAKSLELPAGADEVWGVVGDFNGLARWNAGVATSDLSKEGKRRTLTLKAGGSVVEDLVDYDAARRRYSYSIVAGPIPVTRHKATLAVLERGSDKCMVHWSCEFEPKGVDTQTVAAIFTGIYEGGLNQLDQMFSGRPAKR